MPATSRCRRITPAFVDRLDVAMLPRRRWLLGRALLRGNLTLKIAPPGVGKSTLGIEQAVAIVTGRPITGQEVHEQTKVWIYNNEDDADELKRRLAAVLHPERTFRKCHPILRHEICSRVPEHSFPLQTSSVLSQRLRAVTKKMN